MQIKRNARRLFHEIRDHFVRIDVQGFRHIEKFNDIQAPLSNFDAGDLSLRGFQARGECVLRHFGRLAGRNERCA